MILDYLSSLLVVLAIALMVWYIAGWITGAGSQNMQWKMAKQRGMVSPELRRYYHRYGDKQRFILFWLQAQRLQNVDSYAVVAELGVYRGDTALLLHLLMPQRELFLFDTFDGFAMNDLVAEQGEAASYTTGHFADTSVNRVIERIGSKAEVCIFKGDFAATSAKVPERRYALVSLDADLGLPTKAGLEYFYPRLIPGGVMIVHDYHPKWPALMEAVDTFLDKIPENGVLIPDRNNSLVIVKTCANARQD